MPVKSSQGLSNMPVNNNMPVFTRALDFYDCCSHHVLIDTSSCPASEYPNETTQKTTCLLLLACCWGLTDEILDIAAAVLMEVYQIRAGHSACFNMHLLTCN